MINIKYLQRFFVVLFIGFFMCSIQACREDDDENTELIDNTGETNNTDEMDYSLLIGMWQLEGTEDLNITHFKSDGTAITYYGENGHIQETYTYTLNGNQLKMEGVNNVNTRILNIRHLTSSELVLCYTPFSVELTNRYKRYYGELPNTGNNNDGNNDGVTSINSPTNVQAYENDGKVTITWSSVSGASTYSVWRSSSSNGSYSPLVYSTSGTTHTDYNPNTGYNYYKVKAHGGQDIESDFSSYASVYVEKKEETPIVQKPNAPTGVTVSNEGNDYYPDVVIRWNEVSGADKYYVYRSSSANGSYSKIATVQWNAYTDNTAPTSQASYYKVKAVNSAGESPYSSYAVYTPVDNDKAFAPGAPIWGSCTVSGTRVTLRWSYPTGNGYGVPTKAKLRAKLGGVNTWVDIKELSGTATSVTWDFSTGYVEFDGNKQYLYVGIVLENEKGTGSNARIYNITERKWVM